MATNNQKSKKHPLKLWISLAAFIVFIIIILLFLQPWRKINEVQVNTLQLSEQQVKKYANVEKHTPYWRVAGQTAFIAHHIVQQDKRIDAATVTLHNDQVIIDVVEKIKAGYVQKKGQWFVINRQGKLNKVGKPNGDAPTYSGFKSEKDIQIVGQQFVVLELTLRQNISQIIFSPNKDNHKRLEVVMNDGNMVYATLDTFGKKISFYPGIVAQMPKKGVIDLQFGAYSYAYGSQNNTSTSKSKKSK